MRREQSAEEKAQWDAWKAAFVQAGVDGWKQGLTAPGEAKRDIPCDTAIARKFAEALEHSPPDERTKQFEACKARLFDAIRDLREMVEVDYGEWQAKNIAEYVAQAAADEARHTSADITPAPPAPTPQPRQAQESAKESFESWANRWWRTDADKAYEAADRADSDDGWLDAYDCDN